MFTGGYSDDKASIKVDHIVYRIFEVRKLDISVELRDFRDTIAGSDDFLYLDPPYDLSVNLYGFDYSDKFSHEDLRDLIIDRPGWILSYNDTEYIRELYKGHRYVSLRWHQFFGVGANTKPEILILSKDFEPSYANI